MSNTSTLVTVAMLSALLSEKHTDYLDLISPFILSLLPCEKGEKVNKESIIVGLQEKYGFVDFPVNVLDKILSRNRKLRFGYVRKVHSHYVIEKPYEKSRFDERRKQIQKAQSEVINRLKNFLCENTKYKNISTEKTRDLFSSFLESNGIAFVNGINQLKLITSKDYENYAIARFILTEYEAKSHVFSDINEVVRGFFIYKSIYYFSKEQKTSLNSKLKGTTLYFDTRLLIEALGYNTPEGKKASRELIKLVYDAGGQIKTFTHLKDEVAGILTKYARDPISRLTMRLEYFDVNKYNEIDILRHRSNLIDALNHIHISVEDAVPETELCQQVKEYIDIPKLTACLRETLGHQFQPDRINNDVSSIASIYSLRKGCRCFNIENCKSILVTTNSGFTQAVNNYLKPKCNGEINLIIDDIDITALLWLRTWDKKNNIPTDILIENAYAACQPSPELISTFSKAVNRLQKEDQITSNEALLLRTELAPKDDLLFLTQNDPDAITDNMIIQIRDKYASTINDQLSRKIDDLHTALESERSKKFTAIDKAEANAYDESEKYGRRLRNALVAVFIVIMLLGSIATILSVTPLDYNIVWKIIIAVIGFLGFLDILNSRKGWINSKINKLKKKRFDTIYDSEIAKITQYFG